MPTRRQAKVARIVKEVVSEAIANHLNDPRISGFISVTRVEVAADLRSADVYLSIFSEKRALEGESDPVTSARINAAQERTFQAITHAKNRIQALVARRMQTKFCPVLGFYRDDKFKKTLETIQLIERTASENKENMPEEQDDYEPNQQ